MTIMYTLNDEEKVLRKFLDDTRNKMNENLKTNNLYAFSITISA